MNLPNLLSFLRALLAPVMVTCFYIKWPIGGILGLVTFTLAAATDYFDGYLARKHNIVTTLGKFIDPLADKLLVLSAFVMFADKGMLPGYVVVLVLFRDLAIDGLRLAASAKSRVIAAGALGKIKTVSQMSAIIALFVTSLFPIHAPIANILVIVMAILTVWSGIDYFVHNGAVLFQTEEG